MLIKILFFFAVIAWILVIIAPSVITQRVINILILSLLVALALAGTGWLSQLN